MIESVKKLVREASEEMLTDTFEIAHKEGFANIVTTSDLAVQNFLKKGLSILLPGSGFLCEEEVISWVRNIPGLLIPSTVLRTIVVVSTNVLFA